MGNKYSKWNMAVSYTNKDKVSDKILNREPFIIAKEKKEENDMVLAPSVKYSVKELLSDVINMEIIARLACSGALTIEQLVCFLNLQGYDIQEKEVKEKIDYMQKEYILYVFPVFSDGNTEYMDCIILRHLGIMIGNALGAVSLKEAIFLFDEFKNVRNKKAYGCIFANSIILWQLLNNQKNVKSFKLNYDKKIALLLRTRWGIYAFIQCTYYDVERAENIISVLNSVNINEKCPVIPILIVKNEIMAAKLMNRINSEGYDKKIFYILYEQLPLNKERKIQCVDKVGNSNIKLHIAEL